MKSENSPSSYNASTPIQIAIVAEGPTEQQFILNHLTPYLHDMSGGRIKVQAITVKTGRAANGKVYSGGGSWYSKSGQGYDQLIRGLLSQPQLSLVSTMIDYYGFPQDFIKRAGLKNPELREIESQMRNLHKKEAQSGKWLPFVVKHEFETLVIAAALHGPSNVFSNSDVREMHRWAKKAHGVEEINNSPHTAPSKRIIKLKAGSTVKYRKIEDSAEIFERARLEDVMSECPHFKTWVQSLLSTAD